MSRSGADPERSKAGGLQRELLASEKKALHGLIKYPLLNDRELAERIGLKMSTLTAIKNRLKESDLFFTVRVPNFHRIGNELLIVSTYKMNPLMNPRQKEKVLRRFIVETPGVILHMMGTEYDLSVHVARNYTEARRYFDRLEMLMSANDIVEPEGSQQLYFSFEMTAILNFFDFSRPLEALYGFKTSSPHTSKGSGGADASLSDITGPGLDVERLTTKEKRVLYGLVRHPDLPDKAVAREVGVTRQTVNRLKKEFEEGGLFRTMRIPNIRRIGAEIIILSLSRFNPQMTLEKRRKGISLVSRFPQILSVSSDMEAANLFITSDFRTYQEFKDQIMAFYKKHDYFSDEPEIILFSIDGLQMIKDHVYADLLAHSLGLDMKK